jgi:Leucine-rich repeat (LRR) protein
MTFGPQLEVLWLQSNKLSALTHLDACAVRLRELYAHDNQLVTLKGSLLRLKHIEVLDLADNTLRGLDKLLHALGKLPRLRVLRLVGNPCCEELRYRNRVLSALPKLLLLDEHWVRGSMQTCVQTCKKICPPPIHYLYRYRYA